MSFGDVQPSHFYQDVSTPLQEPVAFWGGFTAGALALNLKEDPLRSWIEQTANDAQVLDHYILQACSTPAPPLQHLCRPVLRRSWLKGLHAMSLLHSLLPVQETGRRGGLGALSCL